VEETDHFRVVVEERRISRYWIELTLREPDNSEMHDDGTRHFLKQIDEYDGRWLRVVVNAVDSPEKLVTAFFDRRLRKSK
jgi:hypothetical protein